MYNSLPDLHETLLRMDMLIRGMSVDQYCGWVKAQRPGFGSREPDVIESFLRAQEVRS